ncbi:cyclic pyranopterin monophosphate synthase MoaC [Luteimonas yindakuii]|uniref:cyclic pyranopterin monophosphate synthase n=1 Tax=Luteimonas yindakuii TaxID=2565782 RepID=A0A4Z1R6A9_9GAMM|nr:cyclic pyranopterin monophosphate synthase MoaC [Luteimonas yindakuii]QCO68087.2 cyclic pyranopterin monophosphate synthase MoaC [Luteimonas yindakuii]TKS54446.1 cyclic pyranopterin monophosphate synthase MoaC [Luteimonas yindakuii]
MADSRSRTKPPTAAPALTHLDAEGRPAMVDVSAKPATARSATARCDVRFPAAVAAQLHASGLRSAKGGIVDTAVIAGTMAVKRTHELIPFCHPLPIDGIRIAIDWEGERALRIECTVHTVHRTGVEMEALTGATVAALTIYDMCKALSHAITIGPARLMAKRGGRRDIGASP